MRRHPPTIPSWAKHACALLAAWVLGSAALAAPDAATQPGHAKPHASPTKKADTAPAAAAEPAAPGDRITQFLGERGLVGGNTGEPSMARQMRDRAADWTSDLVLSAMNFLGVRYRRGGDSADEGFDCSGFTRHVFEASIGLVLPRRANEQAKTKALQPILRDELKPGDLVFFNTLRTAFSHVGIYVGDGKFIHAPRTGGEVRVEDMRVAYWSKRFNGARRAVVSGDAAPADKPAADAAGVAPAATAASAAGAAPAAAGNVPPLVY